MLWLTAFAMAGSPEVEVRWKGGVSTLHVLPQVGLKVSPDAPVDLSLEVGERARAYSVEGAALLAGLPLGEVRGVALGGVLEFQVCEDGTGICRPEKLTIEGVIPASKKGQVSLTTGAFEGGSEEEHHSPFNQDAAPITDAVFADATAANSRVLLDFSAVWCPPCNLLAAEVLHAEDARETLAGLQVAVIDVDHRSSWELKDKYGIGSYPTVVITDRSGKELDRMVGYPGREAFLAFVQGADQPAPDWDAVDPATLEPDVAAKGLIRVLDAHGEADVWAKAAAKSDTWEAHVGRFRHDPNEAELAWLVSHDPARSLDWLPYVGDWGEKEGRALLLAAMPRLLAAAGPVEAADILWYAAQMHDEEQARADYATAATLLRSSFAGDFVKDRGHYEFVATLLEKAGEGEEALDLLDQTAEAHPDDPTFLLAAAYLLNERKDFAAAMERTERGLVSAWDDNRLRMAHEQCVALVGLDRAEEAAALARKTLDEVPAPAAELKVRTHRYREKLETFLK